ncbi:MAG: cupin domain-containing protein [Actinomycetota bacterium]
MTDLVIDATELARRVIPPTAFVADTQAFVDVRLPQSTGKASYSFIGAGVSQNADTVVNLVEPHGFCVGAAAMPHGVVNNPHLHYTAEVFLCTRGRWRFDIGSGGEQSLELGPGDVFSIPTWVFRGFENIGEDDGWLFSVLGGDDTGGILWAPEVLRQAAETGLYLAADHSVLDAADGPVGEDALAPLDDAELVVDTYTDAELEAHVSRPPDLAWSDRALLASVLADHRVRLAPVIGFGLTEDRRHRPPISHPHGFSLEWLEVEPGSSTGRHRFEGNAAAFLTEGYWHLRLNGSDDAIATDPPEGSVVSLPGGAWRELVNTGDQPARALMVTPGDARVHVEWAPEILTAAADAGWARDASGYVAPLRLLGIGADR